MRAVAACFSIDYRLGPEHRFPAAVDDGYAATAWIAANCQRFGRRFAAAGDMRGLGRRDAGGGGVPDVARTRGYRHWPFSSCSARLRTFRSESDSRRELAQGYLVDRDTLEHDLKYYLGPGDDPADPRISPLRAEDLQGLPPTVIHTAEYDPLRDEGRAYAEQLEAAGVRTLYRCHPGMIHLFYGMRGLIPYAGDAFAQMGADIRSLLEAA